jgi:hypothetical protein
MEYETFCKKIGHHGEYTILLWVAQASIEINDWFNATGAVIEMCKPHLDNPEKINKTLGFKGGMMAEEYLHLSYHKQTEKVVFRNKGDEYEDGYSKEWRTITIYIPYFKQVVKEIEAITK